VRISFLVEFSEWTSNGVAQGRSFERSHSRAGSRRALFVAACGVCILLRGAVAQEKEMATYSDRAAAAHAGEVAIISGKVVAVAKSRSGTTYLNFGDRFPAHTFSGVVLPRDEAKVGDVRQFEGKVISITGKITLAQDKKPQIVIRSADQIALGPGETPAKSAPPPAPEPAPSPPEQPAKAALQPSPAVRKIVLGAAWRSPTQTGELTRKDLARIFFGHGSANDETEGDASLRVYNDIPYLTPVGEAKRRLRLDGLTSSKTKVVCPGMPLDSFWFYAFDGVFPGGFDRLCLITDSADQVVSVQLVEDLSRERSLDFTDLSGYHTYNFVSYRVKGTGNLVIKHEVSNETPELFVVESTLIDPTDNENPTAKKGASKRSTKTPGRVPRTGKVLERSRWFVPKPVVNLILRCVENRG
jgi:hypothetical protein